MIVDSELMEMAHDSQACMTRLCLSLELADIGPAIGGKVHCLKIIVSADSRRLESPELRLQELPLISRKGDTFGSRLDTPCLLVLSGKHTCQVTHTYSSHDME